MRQQVLITGGLGFVGSQLLQLLARRNDIHPYVLDNGLSGGRIEGDYTFFHLDIRDESLHYLIPQFDTIVHLAGIVGEPACAIDPRFAYDVNINGTQNILNSMRSGQKIIFASSSSVYGNRPNELVTEETQPLPLNHYGQHKLDGERAVCKSGHDYVIVRPATAFGISARTRMDLLVNSLIYDALVYHRLEIYEPNTIRPIIHVLDFARVLVEAIDGRIPNGVYNIADPSYNLTKLALAEYIAQRTEAKITIGLGTNLDPRNYDIAIDKLLATGFTFQPYRIEKAIVQISNVIDEIAESREKYTTPYQVRKFLLREK